jgi:hypothetical protein
MHWIEQLFGVSPDNGNGTTEAAIAFASLLLASAAARVARRRLWRRSKRGHR